MSHKDPTFNVYTFFNWFNKQDVKDIQMDKPCAAKSQQENSQHVVSRLGLERLEKQIHQHNNQLSISEVKQIAARFETEGGMLVETIDLDALIIIDEIGFRIPKSYVKSANAP